MSDTKQASVVLEPFEGKPVVGVVAEVRGVDGGLNRGMKLDPVVHVGGDRAFIAFEVETRSIRHDPATKGENDGEQLRVQIYDAEKAIILEGALLDAVSDALDAQHAAIVEHEEAVEREQATLKEQAKAQSKEQAAREKAEAAGQTNLVDAVGTTPIRLDDARAQKRAEKVEKSTKATKAAGRATKRAPAKKATKRASKRVTH